MELSSQERETLTIEQLPSTLGEAAKALKEDEFLGRILGGHILLSACSTHRMYLKSVIH